VEFAHLRDWKAVLEEIGRSARVDPDSALGRMYWRERRTVDAFAARVSPGCVVRDLCAVRDSRAGQRRPARGAVVVAVATLHQERDPGHLRDLFDRGG
jgi:hypothetical protein